MMGVFLFGLIIQPVLIVLAVALIFLWLESGPGLWAASAFGFVVTGFLTGRLGILQQPCIPGAADQGDLIKSCRNFLGFLKEWEFYSMLASAVGVIAFSVWRIWRSEMPHG